MARPRLVLTLILVTLVACESNDAETGTDDAAAAADAPAATTGSTARDISELRDYDLTMERVDRLFDAQLNMARVASRMSPAERAALETPGEDNANASLDDMVASIERHPLMRDALNEAGLSPRDYALTLVAMMQATMAMSVLQMRPTDDADSLTRAMDTNPDNVRFMQEHMEEITQRQEAAAAEIQQLFPDEE